MYQDWKHASYHGKGTGQIFNHGFESPVDQTVHITFDYQRPRQTPVGCPVGKVFYNLYVNGSDEALVVDGGTGYLYTSFEAKAGEQIPMQVYNWEDTTVNSDFVVNYYTEKAPVIVHTL